MKYTEMSAINVCCRCLCLSRPFSSQPDERPPLLRSWKAHNAALLSVDVAQVADRSFVLAASADGSTSLWTSDGDRVGQFGQAAAWSLTEAAAYQR